MYSKVCRKSSNYLPGRIVAHTKYPSFWRHRVQQNTTEAIIFFFQNSPYQRDRERLPSLAVNCRCQSAGPGTRPVRVFKVDFDEQRVGVYWLTLLHYYYYQRGYYAFLTVRIFTQQTTCK